MQFCGDLPLYYVILSAAKDLEVCMRVDGRAIRKILHFVQNDILSITKRPKRTKETKENQRDQKRPKRPNKASDNK